MIQIIHIRSSVSIKENSCIIGRHAEEVSYPKNASKPVTVEISSDVIVLAHWKNFRELQLSSLYITNFDPFVIVNKALVPTAFFYLLQFKQRNPMIHATWNDKFIFLLIHDASSERPVACDLEILVFVEVIEYRIVAVN